MVVITPDRASSIADLTQDDTSNSKVHYSNAKDSNENIDDNNNRHESSNINGADHELILTPLLIETLDSSHVVDPTLLIKPDEISQFPIGMSNFNLKRNNHSSPNLFVSPIKKSNDLTSQLEKSKQIREKWKKAAMKIKLMKDPWYEFHIESYPVEQVTRHRYNPIRKEWKKDKCFVKMEQKQFANGAMRACFRLKKLSNFSHDKSWRTASNYVAKCYKSSDIPRERYFDEARLQMDAKLWAEVYNRHNPPKKIDMFQVSILEFDQREGSPLFHLEHYIEGNYIKYNSNAGFVEDAHMRFTPHAFSHFTFECSNHELIVVDIQGVGDLYTDPQIHTASGDDYGDGNLGVRGFALFFYSHVCNDICKSLGLTEFDLAPSEKLSHTQYMNCLKNKAGLTKRRGHEEPLFNQQLSARTRYLLNKWNRSNSDDYNDIIELDECSSHNHSSLGINFSSTMSLLSHNSSSHHSPQPKSLAFSFDSNNTSMCDNPFKSEEAIRFLTQNIALNKPRPSAVLPERNAMLNADTEFMRRIQSLGSYESILGKTHLEMCKYHENGRFLTSNENDQFDQDAAFFHLQQSANLGVTEALVNIAKIYMQLPHDILPEYKVDDTDENYDTGFEYMTEAAEKGDKSSLYFIAKAYDNGIGLSKLKQIDWQLAVEYYRKLISYNHDHSSQQVEELGYSDIGFDCEPDYMILGRLGQMYLDGLNGVDKNPHEANELFNEAAEKAIACGNGRLANKYYGLAEKALQMESGEEESSS